MTANNHILFDQLSTGGYRLSCPSCAKGRTDKTLGVTINSDGSGVAHCFRCGLKAFNKSRGSLTVAPPSSNHRPILKLQTKRTRLSDDGHRLWAACQPISGAAAAYLQARRCVIPPTDGDLRWHPCLAQENSTHRGPALVGLITNVFTGEPMSLHRTWITEHGKAAIQIPKKLLPGHSIVDGCIRLWGDEMVSTGLGIGEGIETCLTLAHAFQPVWCAIDAGHLQKFPVLPGVESITIARDMDATGKKAAHECALRWQAAGRNVFWSTQSGNDLNDEVANVRRSA